MSCYPALGSEAPPWQSRCGTRQAVCGFREMARFYHDVFLTGRVIEACEVGSNCCFHARTAKFDHDSGATQRFSWQSRGISQEMDQLEQVWCMFNNFQPRVGEHGMIRTPANGQNWSDLCFLHICAFWGCPLKARRGSPGILQFAGRPGRVSSPERGGCAGKWTRIGPQGLDFEDIRCY